MHLEYVIRTSYIICTYISIVGTTTVYSYVDTYYTMSLATVVLNSRD